MKDHWEINYARFFCFPCTGSSSASSLLSLSKRLKQKGLRGTWLSSAHVASVKLRRGERDRDLVLVVSIRGRNKEEHYLPRLHFYWPQVACPPDCPMRGSRVVFASYKDSLGEVQKFAMRFAASNESKSFMESLKNCLEPLVPPGLALADGVRHVAATTDTRNIKAVQNNECPMQPPLNPGNVQCFEESTIANASGAASASFPLRFTAILSDTCTVAEQGPVNLNEKIDLSSQMELQAHALNSSFQDLLTKIEMTISVLGGDLALE